jgi:acylphosphatase
MEQVAKHIIYTGNVQGIGFRFTALDAANRYKLTGFVRNLRDGSVEMLAQGLPADIDNCVREIKRAIGSYITGTKIENAAPNPEFRDFRITF